MSGEHTTPCPALMELRERCAEERGESRTRIESVESDVGSLIEHRSEHEVQITRLEGRAEEAREADKRHREAIAALGTRLDDVEKRLLNKLDDIIKQISNASVEQAGDSVRLSLAWRIAIAVAGASGVAGVVLQAFGG